MVPATRASTAVASANRRTKRNGSVLRSRVVAYQWIVIGVPIVAQFQNQSESS